MQHITKLDTPENNTKSRQENENWISTQNISLDIFPSQTEG